MKDGLERHEARVREPRKEVITILAILQETNGGAYIKAKIIDRGRRQT